MNETVDPFAHAPQRYELLAGTSEMMLGFACLLFAAMVWISTQSGVTWLSLTAALGACALLWAISAIVTRYARSKLVYSRSGYMKARKRPWKPVLLAASTCTMATAAVLIFSQTSQTLIPLIVSLAISAAMLVASILKDARRFTLYAVLSGSWGALVYLTGLSLNAGMMLYYLLLGATFILAGIWTMISYIRNTPQPGPEAE